MENVRTVSLPGQVWGLAAPGPAGPVFVACHDGRDRAELTVLVALDPQGRELWRRAYDGYPVPPRVGPDGTVWIAHREASGAVLTGLDAAGAVVGETALEHEADEHLGAFVVLADGFCVSWIVAERFLYLLAGQGALVARHARDGSRRWSSAALRAREGAGHTIEVVADAGADDSGAGSGADPGAAGGVDAADAVDTAVDAAATAATATATAAGAADADAAAATADAAASPGPWKPRSIAAAHWEPLLVAGDRVAATFAETGSGIAVTFFHDAATGRVVAATRPGPNAHMAIAAPGEFLIGYQGYGVFQTSRHDSAGTVTQEWKTHVMPLVDADGAVSGPESQNVSPDRSRFVRLEADGTVLNGAALSGYYTSYPALDDEGTAVFWRDGAVRAVDRDLKMRDLLVLSAERSVASRVLLLDGGRVVLALNDEVFILEETGLGALNGGVWPCGDGGLQGNPVLDA